MPTQPVLGTRRTFHDEIRVEAPAHAVFPLLCPVREYDWTDGWTCVMIHSASGLAEDGCIFQTAFRGEGQMTWVVSGTSPANGSPSRASCTRTWSCGSRSCSTLPATA